MGIVFAIPFIRIALFFHIHQMDPMRVMPSHADALALGMLTAIVWRNPACRLWLTKRLHFVYWMAGLLFVGFGLLWWYAPSSESLPMASFGYTWIATFYALLVLIVLVASKGWIARAMRVNWLREIGRVSYCMYLIHLIVNIAVHFILLHARPQIVTTSGAAVSILAAIVTYALALLSWEIVEGPLVQIGHRYRYSMQADP